MPRREKVDVRGGAELRVLAESWHVEPRRRAGVQTTRRAESIPSDQEANMRWVMLPVSVGAHVIAALAILIVPLAAEVEWPAPAPLHSALVTNLAPVPPEVVKLAAPRRTVAVPSVAPALVAPESDVPAVAGKASTNEVPAGAAIASFLPGDIGSSVAITVPMAPDPPPPV